LPKLPGVNQLDAVRAFEKAGFWVAPGQARRNDQWSTYSDYSPSQPRRCLPMGGIIRDAGLTIEQFRELL
jgi:hypothetical protein